MAKNFPLYFWSGKKNFFPGKNFFFPGKKNLRTFFGREFSRRKNFSKCTGSLPFFFRHQKKVRVQVLFFKKIWKFTHILKKFLVGKFEKIAKKTESGEQFSGLCFFSCFFEKNFFEKTRKKLESGNEGFLHVFRVIEPGRSIPFF